MQIEVDSVVLMKTQLSERKGICEPVRKRKKPTSVVKHHQNKKEGCKRKKKRSAGKSAASQQNIKRCGSAVNELTIKPQDEKESQLFWNYGAMTA